MRSIPYRKKTHKRSYKKKQTHKRSYKKKQTHKHSYKKKQTNKRKTHKRNNKRNKLKHKNLKQFGGKDLYKLLGVSRDCDADALKKAYRRLAMKYHPDKGGGDQDVFNQVKEAYDILRDPEQRSLYDARGHDGLEGGFGRGSGHGFGGTGQRRPQEGKGVEWDGESILKKGDLALALPVNGYGTPIYGGDLINCEVLKVDIPNKKIILKLGPMTIHENPGVYMAATYNFDVAYEIIRPLGVTKKTKDWRPPLNTAWQREAQGLDAEDDRVEDAEDDRVEDAEDDPVEDAGVVLAEPVKDPVLVEATDASGADGVEVGVPEYFNCPITGELMTDPVVDPEGNSYERSAIEMWLNGNPTSPVTRTPLSPRQLAPNRALRDAIEGHPRTVSERAAKKARRPRGARDTWESVDAEGSAIEEWLERSEPPSPRRQISLGDSVKRRWREEDRERERMDLENHMRIIDTELWRERERGKENRDRQMSKMNAARDRIIKYRGKLESERVPEPLPTKSSLDRRREYDEKIRREKERKGSRGPGGRAYSGSRQQMGREFL